MGVAGARAGGWGVCGGGGGGGGGGVGGGVFGGGGLWGWRGLGLGAGGFAAVVRDWAGLCIGGAVWGACEIGRTKPFRLKSKELACGCGWMWGGGPGPDRCDERNRHARRRSPMGDGRGSAYWRGRFA